MANQLFSRKVARKIKKDLLQVKLVGALVILAISLPALTVPSVLAFFFNPGIDKDGVVRLLEVFRLTAPLVAAITLVGTAYLRGWADDINLYGHFAFVAAIFIGVAMVFNLFGFSSLPPDLLNYNCSPSTLLIDPSIRIDSCNYQNFGSRWGLAPFDSKPSLAPFGSRPGLAPFGSRPALAPCIDIAMPTTTPVCSLNKPGNCFWYKSIRCTKGWSPVLIPIRGIVSPLLSYWNFYGLWNFLSSLVVGVYTSWVLALKVIPYIQELGSGRNG